jgi:hypothetical protein
MCTYVVSRSFGSPVFRLHTVAGKLMVNDTYKRTTCEAMIKLSLISDSDIKLLKFDCENKLQQHAIAAT